MANKHEKQDAFQKIEIGLPKDKTWSAEKSAAVKAAIKEHAAKRSAKQKLTNEMVAIELKMTHYVNEESMNTRKFIKISDFVHQYLSLINLSFKRFAEILETKDSNLKKYVDGERSFNSDLAMKFGNFFHSSPDLWLKVHAKNELLQLRDDIKNSKKYKMYDYTTVIEYRAPGTSEGTRNTAVYVKRQKDSAVKAGVTQTKHSATYSKAEESWISHDGSKSLKGSNAKANKKGAFQKKVIEKKQSK